MAAAVSQAWGPDVIDLPEGTLRIGRGVSAGVSLTHVGVSRRHATLSVSAGCMIIRDLGSRSGTRVNGVAVREKTLQDGDRVDFGPVGYQVCGRQLHLVERADGARLEAHGLVIVRGGLRLLDDIHLTIQPGQFVGLLGASGSGKSTLLKCLAGYSSPVAGTIRCDDLVLPGDLEVYRASIGFVPQDDIVFQQLKARENLDFTMRLRIPSLTRVERAREVGDVLRRLRLDEHAEKLARVLSGGQRKRVQVGLALLVMPRVLFLDEPTSGLDPANEKRLMASLKDLSVRGLTVVCATHELRHIALFDQVIAIAGGTVAYAGPPAHLKEHFGATGLVDLYGRLEVQDRARPAPQADAPLPPALPSVSTTLPADPLVPVLAAPRATQHRIPCVHQIKVLVARGFRQMSRDYTVLAFLVLQPIGIGFLICLSQMKPDGLMALFLFASVTSIWLGLNNTARAVIGERSTYVRERLLGITPEGYLGAKAVQFGLIGFAQVLLLVIVLWSCCFLSPDDTRDLRARSFVWMVSVFGVAYLSGMLLGLLVSTLAISEESAVAYLPLLVLPQILLSGVATGLDSARTGAFRSLVIMVERTGTADRGAWSWVQESASLLLYSRPALALLQNVPDDKELPSAFVIRAVDWSHALLLLSATAALLLKVFHSRERRWLERF